MEQIWVVTDNHDYYEDDEIQGVFSTREKAEKFVENLLKTMPGLKWEKHPFHCLKSKGIFIDITRHKIDYNWTQ